MHIYYGPLCTNVALKVEVVEAIFLNSVFRTTDIVNKFSVKLQQGVNCLQGPFG